jgi:hypothetical protein
METASSRIRGLSPIDPTRSAEDGFVTIDLQAGPADSEHSVIYETPVPPSREAREGQLYLPQSALIPSTADHFFTYVNGVSHPSPLRSRFGRLVTFIKVYDTVGMYGSISSAVLDSALDIFTRVQTHLKDEEMDHLVVTLLQVDNARVSRQELVGTGSATSTTLVITRSDGATDTIQITDLLTLHKMDALAMCTLPAITPTRDEFALMF